jgi:hypothetical protein
METQNKIFDNLKNKNISASSLKLYLNNLKRLNGGQEIKNFNFLKDTEKIVNHIKDYKPNTRRSYLISIVSLLKQEPKFKKLYDSYYKMLMEYNKDLQVNNDKSETQKENWITQEQVLEVYKKLEDDLMPKLNKKKITEDEYKELLSFVVLSLYTLQAPRRNLDYLYMVMVKKYSEDMDKKFNYLDLENMMFHFNNYKTQKTYKTQSIPVSPELQKVIHLYLSFHPLKSEIKKKNTLVPFLVSYQGVPFEPTNTITRILNKIFGKKIGASMLRNIYLTSKYSNNLENLNEDASNMGTSSSTIQNQYVKLDNPVTDQNV